jgi:hypothetical protein
MVINVCACMYTYTMNENEIKYCVNCGMSMEMPDYDLLSMCYACTAFSTKSVEYLSTYVPSVCGDDVCYLDHQGMPNFDGECDHEDEFYSVFDNQ